jgi:hypothetical protein
MRSSRALRSVVCSRDFERSHGPCSPRNQAKVCLPLRVDACAGGSSKDCFHCLESRCVRFSATRQLLLPYGCDSSERRTTSGCLRVRRCPMGAGPMRAALVALHPRNKHVRSRSRHVNAKKCECVKSINRWVAAKKRLIRNILDLGARSITH